MGNRVAAAVFVVFVFLGVSTAAVGADAGADFNEDGVDDVFWYAPGPAADYVWHGGRSGFSSRPVSVNGDYRPVAGDFNGDGVDDIIWYAPGAAADYVWYGGRSGFSSKPISVNGDYRPVVGDFDGNGFDDVIWYAPGAGADYLWSSSKSGFSSKPLSVAGDYRPVAGDFNGDGVDDIIWYAPGAAADYVWYGGRSGFSSKPISVNGDYRPVVGDFDGNGFDDVIWYAPGAGADYLWSSSKSGFSSKPLSVAGDYRPVAGDFNGDGVDDVIWYAPGAAADYVWYGSRSGFSSKPISVNGDYRPVGNVWWEDPPPPPSRSPRPTQNPLRNLAPGQVALTFDDGPSRYTPQVLDILDRAGVPATFFVVGDRVASGAPILQRAHRSGHSIQNHTWSHAALAGLSDGAIASQLGRTADAIEAAIGERPTCFRPPYGSQTSRVVSVASAVGSSPSVLWNVETSDYSGPSPTTIAHRALSPANGRGLIILMHDGGGARSNTVAALPTIISELKRRGYEFVTLCN